MEINDLIKILNDKENKSIYDSAQLKVLNQELRIEKDTKITTTRYLEKRTKMKKRKVVIVSGYFDRYTSDT